MPVNIIYIFYHKHNTLNFVRAGLSIFKIKFFLNTDRQLVEKM